MWFRTLLFTGFIVQSLFTQVAVASTFMVAAGAVDVTPPVGTFLAGYGLDRQATGSYDKIWIKAVIIADQKEQLAIVTIDCIGLTRPDILSIAARIKDRLPGIRLIVSSTHTHAGPDVVGIWGSARWLSGRDDGYMETLVSQTASLVIRTAHRVQPAKSRVASVDAALAWVENRSEPNLLDSRLSVLQFVDATGDNIATLTNFACHPTVLGPENTLVSSDYVTGFYRNMAANVPGEHLFLQGAIGGWVQPLQGDRSHELALEHGRSLSIVALDALRMSDDNAYAPLEFVERELDVPLENWGFRLMMWLGVLDRESYDGAMRTSVAWFRIGSAEFVTHPGETSPAYSIASRDLMDSPHTFVMGLTQDAMGYILKPGYFADDAAYPHASYLTSVSVGEQAGPRVMSALETIVP